MSRRRLTNPNARTIRRIATPPPVGLDKEQVREYAAASRRVADARGIPVADLYSGFMGMPQNVELFPEMLSGELDEFGYVLIGFFDGFIRHRGLQRSEAPL